ncbi:MAG: outer membrane protein [Helicobacter sp.]|nr:outer membrane protein [Helicobacter sp.]
MTKKIACALAAMSIVSGALAQEENHQNAPFVGVTVGSSRLDRVAHYGNNTSMSDSSSGGYFGILAGYRYFVQPELAIRGYGELEYHPIKIEYDDGSNKDSNYTNFIVGADALYYLKQGDDFDISALAGLGIALSRYSQEMLLNSEKRALGFAFRAGVHFDIASEGKKRHGIDVGLKILPNKVTTSTPETRYYYGTTLKAEQKPSFFVRYTYGF